MGKEDKKAEFGRAREAVTNLLKAAAEGQVGTLKECVSKQAVYDETNDLQILKNLQDGNERRALHFAALSAKLAAVQHIISVGVAQDDEAELRELVDCPDKEGDSALLLACNAGQVDSRAALLVVKLLVEKGFANVNLASKSGSTALHHAVSTEQAELVSYLLEKGANPNAISEMGSPLFIAVIKDRTDLANILLGAKADASVGAGPVPPPICCAAAMGNVPMLKVLLEGGGSVKAVDADGWTPLHAALDAGHRECADILTQAGANPSITANDGRTAADMVGGIASAKPVSAASPAAERPSLSPDVLKEVNELKETGNACIKAGEFANAAAAYTKAIALDNYNAVLYNNRAAAYLKQDQVEQALADAQEAKKLSPLWVKAMYREGEAYCRLEKYGEGAASFWEGLMTEPGNKEMHRRFKEAVAAGKAKHKAENGGVSSAEESSSSSDEEGAMPEIGGAR